MSSLEICKFGITNIVRILELAQLLKSKQSSRERAFSVIANVVSNRFEGKYRSPEVLADMVNSIVFNKLNFKNTKNLFIHIARIPIGDSPRVHPNIFKMSPPFASSEGYSASGVRYQSDGECVTHLLPHS